MTLGAVGTGGGRARAGEGQALVLEGTPLLMLGARGWVSTAGVVRDTHRHRSTGWTATACNTSYSQFISRSHCKVTVVFIYVLKRGFTVKSERSTGLELEMEIFKNKNLEMFNFNK